MLYTASLTQNLHIIMGLLFSISECPRTSNSTASSNFSIPNTDMKRCPGDQCFTEYTEQYQREQIKNSWHQVKSWLDHLDPKQHSRFVWEVRW